VNYLLEILFVGLNTLQAWWHYRLIKANKPIRHFLWGLAYFGALLALYYFTRHPILIICCFLIREVFFSPVLNGFRKLPFFYTDPMGPDPSFFDSIEGKFLIPIWGTSVMALFILQWFL
jgi:hypothetical protein